MALKLYKKLGNKIYELLAYIETLYKGNLLSLANYTDIKENIDDIKELIGKTYPKEKLEELKELNQEIAEKKKELNKEIAKKKKELKSICYKYLEIKKACGNLQLIKMGLDFAGITLIIYSVIWIVKLFQ